MTPIETAFLASLYALAGLGILALMALISDWLEKRYD
jgi:hypothetical protein